MRLNIQNVVLENFFSIHNPLLSLIAEYLFMAFRNETLTLLPALFLFALSSYFGFFTSQVVDPAARQGLLTLALGLFVGGSVLTLHWGYYWAISRRRKESKSGGVSRVPSFERLISLSLIALGSITLIWVGQLTWQDMTVWKKDLTLIFFGSRTGEAISLGIGIKLIHYFLIGLSLLIVGLAVILRTHKCPHYFGYWTNQPEKESLPKICLICPRVVECVSGKSRSQETLTKPTAKNEREFQKCPHHFGHLRSLPDNKPIPDECANCQRLLECRNLL